MGSASIQNRSQNRAQPPRRPLFPYIRAQTRKSLPRLPTRLLLRRCIHCPPTRLFHRHQQHQLRRSRRTPRPSGGILRLSPFPLRRSQLYPSKPPSSHQHRPSAPRLVGLFPLPLPHPQLPPSNEMASRPYAGPSHTRSRDPRTSTYIGQSLREERQEHRGVGVGFVGTV